jgi:hypothetical protein
VYILGYNFNWTVLIMIIWSGVYWITPELPKGQDSRLVSEQKYICGHCKEPLSLLHALMSFIFVHWLWNLVIWILSYCYQTYNLCVSYAQVGVGLMIFQQLGGINGVGFYASSIFTSAGMQISWSFCCHFLTVLC